MAPRKRKPKQETIPGTQSDRHKDIDAAADTYRELRDNAKELKEQVEQALVALKAAMVKHNLKAYPLADTDPAEEVVLEVAHEEVKIRRVKMPKELAE